MEQFGLKLAEEVHRYKAYCDHFEIPLEQFSF